MSFYEKFNYILFFLNGLLMCVFRLLMTGIRGGGKWLGDVKLNKGMPCIIIAIELLITNDDDERDGDGI